MEEEMVNQIEGDDTPAGKDDVAAVRDMIVATVSGVVPEMIVGSTIAEVLASVEPSRAAYARIADTVRSDRSVPAGGGKPIDVDISALPATEKIRRGLQGR